MNLFLRATLGLAASLPLWLGASCGPIPDYRTLTEVDLHPPEFLGAFALDARTVALRFDEAVTAVPASVSVAPAVGITSVGARESELIITLGADQRAGAVYTVEASVEDPGRNSTSVITTFYGFNPELPELIINEFITQGSGNHPDLVELLVMKGGNTAGACLYEGVASNWDDRMILPPIHVKPGDFLLVHFKPEGLPGELDETDTSDASQGLDASPSAYDLWVKGGSGLSGNNGVLTLYSCPNGTILDAVVYSNRTSSSDSDYGGFGTRDVWDRVQEVERAGEWRAAGERIAPEDAIDPEDSTSTRSIARASDPADTNGAADWHITPTGGASFGTVNSDAVYLP